MTVYEDNSHTLLYHSEALINGFNYAQGSNNTFRYLWHTTETIQPDDNIMSFSDNLVSTVENVYDSLVLQPHRMGHAFGFFKHPELYEFIKQKQIPIEVLPSSSQMLGILFILFLLFFFFCVVFFFFGVSCAFSFCLDFFCAIFLVC